MKSTGSSVLSSLAATLFVLLFTPTSPAQSAHPADLVPRDDTSFDANGLALNPIWGWQQLGQRNEDVDHLCGFVAGLGLRSERPLLLRRMSCMSQHDLIILNERKETVAAGYACNQDTDEGELQGHVNWFVVSALGVVTWQSYGRGIQDHDFTLWLDTLADLRGSLETAWRAREKTPIEIEFNGDEVFGWTTDSLTPWWKMLWRGAQTSDAVPDSMIGVMPAVVTGVFGLDAIHGAHAELHPVYALALLTSQKPEASGWTAEHWAFFVRNGGNEGECSNGFLPFRELPTDSAGRFVFRFTVPWRRGASDVVARWSSGASGVISGTSEADGPRLSKQAARGVQLTFAIPQPVRRGKPTVIVGELDLVWRGTSLDAVAEVPTAVGQHRARKRAREPGQEFEANLGARPDVRQQAALQVLVAERDSNTYVPGRSGAGGVVIPRHDAVLTAAQLVRAAPRKPAPVPVWRSGDYEPSPFALPCNRSVPGCLSNARSGAAVGSVVSRGGGLVVRAILYETKTLHVPSPFGLFPLFSIRFAVGIDHVNPPVSQAAGGATFVNPAVALILRLPPQTRVFGPYALAGPEGYIGREGAFGASIGLGMRVRSGLPTVAFVEGRRAVRVGRADYWAWEFGLLAALF